MFLPPSVLCLASSTKATRGSNHELMPLRNLFIYIEFALHSESQAIWYYIVRPPPPDAEWSRPAASANRKPGCWRGGGERGARWLGREGDGGRRHDACLLSMKTRGARKRRRRRRWRRRRRRGGEGGGRRGEEGEAGVREGGRA